MKKIIFALCMITILSISSSIFAQIDEEVESIKATAVEAAEHWLNLVDEGKYVESWEEAATYFKGVVSAEDWETAITGVRTPLGAIVSRELISSEYHKTLPGAPDGHYVIILFSVSYENKADGVETITPMKEEDGSWRVSGYFIK